MRVRTLAFVLCLPLAHVVLGQGAAADPAPSQAETKRHEKEVAEDKRIGAEYAKQIEKDLKFSENKDMIARVERIGQEFAAIANKTQVGVSWGDSRLSQFDYTFKVIKGDDVNAFSLPGGHIYIYEGLVDFAETDDELASVIAHEVAHAAFRHIATLQREQSKFDIVNLGAILAAIWSRKDATNILLPTQLVNLGMRSGWSVNAEKAADYGGVQYLLKSKYNALGALTFMERLGYRDRFRPEINWGIYESHPPTQERASEMVSHLKEAKVSMNRSSTTTSLRATNKIGDTGIELWFGDYKIHIFAGDDAQKRADRATDRINEFCDSVPALYEIEEREGGSLFGKDRLLLTVTNDDAQAAGMSLQESADGALKALKSAVFDLGYRAWTSRLRSDS